MLFPPAPLSKAGYVLVGLLSCDMSQAPVVNLTFRNDPPRVSRKLTSDLQTLRLQGTSSDFNGEFQHVQGVKDGTFQISYSLNFTQTAWPLLGKSCVQPSALDITLTYTPLIYLNSQISEGSCEYNVTLEHELRHVAVDVQTLEEFIPSVKQMAAATLGMHMTRDPVGKDDVEKRQQLVSEALSKTLDAASARLQETRTYRQQAIDSREEYLRLSNACPYENRTR